MGKSKFIETGLTFDDVLLVPAYSEVLPSEVSLTSKFSRNLSLKVPVVSAAMDTVTESKMAIAMAQEGGIGVIHKNLTIKKQCDKVRRVKRSESGMILDPSLPRNIGSILTIHFIFFWLAGGYKEIIFEINGEDVYGTMKFESGVHRVQRVPQTETQGRVHTSAATVIVLPEAEEFDVDLNMQDVRIERTTSTGPGGQSVNTTYSAIKLHHEPTGIIVSCQDQKSQHKNLDKALKVLRSRLYELEMKKREEADSAKRNSMVSSGDRSAKIRTYNYPQGRVTDHRINLTLYDLQNIVNGDIDKLVEELKIVQDSELIKNEEI